MLITTAAIIIFFIVTYIMGLSQRYYPLFEVLSHSRFMESKNKLSLRTRSISSFYRASVCRCSFCDNSGEKLYLVFTVDEALERHAIEVLKKVAHTIIVAYCSKVANNMIIFFPITGSMLVVLRL